MTCCIIKKKITFSSLLPILICCALTVILALFSAYLFTYLPLFVLLMGVIILFVITPSCLKQEYEYNLEGDTFSVALIKNNNSRKELFACDVAHLISCTPLSMKDTYTRTTLDIQAYVPGENVYYALFSEDEKTVSVTFSPDEEFMKSFRLLSPLKIKLNIL